jgi:hypothetical protein
MAVACAQAETCRLQAGAYGWVWRACASLVEVACVVPWWARCYHVPGRVVACVQEVVDVWVLVLLWERAGVSWAVVGASQVEETWKAGAGGQWLLGVSVQQRCH